ncbi:MAG: enoyl-CoA hydratase [Rhodospirillales bacterium CG15_BIG_FIL_POST_REV_8_21_14_020_66_15]|nr:MAG: enoyl-CoA hydratase [Rhodospirillales bacterium CG15_BIG_FIL_POST_REV_8_21_14_020_66_15]
MLTDSILRDDRGGVTWLTVNRPDKLNVLNMALMTELTKVLRDLALDQDLRAVVITGAGEKAFVGGADIAEMAALDPMSARTFITRLHGVMSAIRDLPVPVIARINGYCLGGGMELAAACDFRIAGDTAKFGMPEVRVGLPSVIEAMLLPHLVGWGRTRWLLMTGEMIDAATAHQWGFVEFLAAPGELDAVLDRSVQAVAAAGPHAIRTQKVLIQSWESLTPAEAIAQTIPVFGDSFETGEPQSMLRDFLARKAKG